MPACWRWRSCSGRSARSLERSVRLCWWPGHSHGRYSGSTWYADTFFTDLAEDGLAYYNIDSPGVKGATVYYCRNTCAELEGYCRVGDRSGDRPGQRAGVPADARGRSVVSRERHAVVLGVSVPARRPSGQAAVDRRIGNAWWWHTEHDTLDKADVSILATDVKVGLEAVWGLANADVAAARLSRNRERAPRRRHGLPVARRGHRLRSAARRRDAPGRGAGRNSRRGAPNAQPAVKRRAWNDTADAAGTDPQPGDVHRGGRFHHDPAEWSPILRATKRFTSRV